MIHASLAIGSLALFAVAQDPSVDLTRLFDSSTNLNGHSQWVSFGYPAADGEYVSFLTWEVSGYSAIIRLPATGGPAIVVADTNTAIPGAPGVFDAFWNPSMHAGSVVFSGRPPATPSNSWIMTGLYAGSASGPRLLADRTTGSYLSLNYPSLHSGLTAFKSGADTGPQALFLTDLTGATSRAITSGMNAPGGGTLFSIGHPSLGNGQMVFDARLGGAPGGTYGVYSFDTIQQSLILVANWTTPVPGATGTFTWLGNPATDGRSTVFNGLIGNPNFGGTEGVYELINGSLRVVADRSTTHPNSNATFEGFGVAAVDDGLVVFTASAGGIAGIFGRLNHGPVFVIAATNRLIDGRTPGFLRISNQGVRGRDVAFEVDFTDRTKAIYTAHIGDFVITGTPSIGTTLSIGIDRPDEAGRLYLAALSLNSSPGIPIANGRVIPLAPDSLLTISLMAGNPIFLNTQGMLDARGQATYQFVIPPMPSLSGMAVVTAWMTYELSPVARFRRLSPGRSLLIR